MRVSERARTTSEVTARRAAGVGRPQGETAAEKMRESMRTRNSSAESKMRGGNRDGCGEGANPKAKAQQDLRGALSVDRRRCIKKTGDAYSDARKRVARRRSGGSTRPSFARWSPNQMEHEPSSEGARGRSGLPLRSDVGPGELVEGGKKRRVPETSPHRAPRREAPEAARLLHLSVDHGVQSVMAGACARRGVSGVSSRERTTLQARRSRESPELETGAVDPRAARHGA
jgi:hypothetical protein